MVKSKSKIDKTTAKLLREYENFISFHGRKLLYTDWKFLEKSFRVAFLAGKEAGLDLAIKINKKK